MKNQKKHNFNLDNYGDRLLKKRLLYKDKKQLIKYDQQTKLDINKLIAKITGLSNSLLPQWIKKNKE